MVGAIKTITRGKRNVLLVRIFPPKIEVVVEEEMKGDEPITKNAEEGMMAIRRGDGAMKTTNLEAEGDLVAIHRIGEDQMARLQEEGGTMKIIAAIAIGIMVIQEERDLLGIDPIDPTEETTIGAVIEEEALEEMITVVVKGVGIG